MFMARTASAPERKRSLTPPSMCGLMARTLRRTSLSRGSAMSVIDMSREKANDGQWRPPKVVEKSMRKFSKLKSRKASTRRPLPPPMCTAHTHAQGHGATRRTARRRCAAPLGDAPRRRGGASSRQIWTPTPRSPQSERAGFGVQGEKVLARPLAPRRREPPRQNRISAGDDSDLRPDPPMLPKVGRGR